MKLKCYLRGLGVGMIVTALILGFRSNATGTAISDEEVIQRARQLGMVESSSLTLAEADREDTETTDAESAETNLSEDQTDQTDNGDGDAAAPGEQQTQTLDRNEDRTEPVGSMEEREVTYSDDPVKLEIQPGASSYTVSKDLAKLGLVKDVNAFDKYLMDNGYATSIQSGFYEILPGTSESDIARMITGR